MKFVLIYLQNPNLDKLWFDFSCEIFYGNSIFLNIVIYENDQLHFEFWCHLIVS